MSSAADAKSSWLDSVKKRCADATAAPWWWATRFFQTRYAVRTRRNMWRAKPGREIRDTWVNLLLGPLSSGWGNASPVPTEPEFDSTKHHFDEWDFKPVLGLRWRHVRGKSLTGTAICGAGPFTADQRFIAASRTDLPFLLEWAEAALPHVPEELRAKLLAGPRYHREFGEIEDVAACAGRDAAL